MINELMNEFAEGTRERATFLEDLYNAEVVRGGHITDVLYNRALP